MILLHVGPAIKWLLFSIIPKDIISYAWVCFMH